MSTHFTPDDLPLLLGTCIVPAIMEYLGVQNAYAIDRFYSSRFYGLLSDPQTSLWHLSPATLAEMYLEEQRTGAFEDPEVQA